MVSFLQIYCSHYGPNARPIAYGFKSKEPILIGIEESDETIDWIAPLNRALESLPIQNTLYLFHGQFETRCLWPYLTKKARTRLKRHVDLYDEIKKRRAIAPLPSYSMTALAKRAGFNEAIFVGNAFAEAFNKESLSSRTRKINLNLQAMARIRDDLEILQNRLRRDVFEIKGFSLHPFQMTGKVEHAFKRYVQYDDLLYLENDGGFTFDGPAKFFPYDEKRQALVLETDAPITQTIPAPEGFLIFAIDDTIYYDTIFALLQWLRDKSL